MLRITALSLLLAPCFAQPPACTATYILMYSGRSKDGSREMDKAVSLRSRFRDLVRLVAINLETPREPDHQKLVRDYYQGFLPHVVVLRCDGSVIYDAAGPADSRMIGKLLTEELKK